MKTKKTKKTGIYTVTKNGEMLSIRVNCVIGLTDHLFIKAWPVAAACEPCIGFTATAEDEHSMSVFLSRKRAMKLAKLLTIMAKQLPKQ